MAGAWSARLAGVTRRGGSLPLSMWSRIDQESYMRQVCKLLRAPVRIGAYAFIGMDAMIMPGVTVGEGAIVGARSLVTRDVEPGAVVGGVPAKQITTAAEAYEKAMESGSWTRQKRPF